MEHLRLKLYRYVLELTAHGVPLTRSLELAAGELGDLDASYAMTNATDRLLRGERFCDAIDLNDSLFPPLARAVIGVAEELGAVPQALTLLVEHEEQLGLDSDHSYERGAFFLDLLALDASPRRARIVLAATAGARPGATKAVSLDVEADPPLHSLLGPHAPHEICALLEVAASGAVSAATWRRMAEYVRADWRDHPTARALFMIGLGLGAGLSYDRVVQVLHALDNPPEFGFFLGDWQQERTWQLAPVMRRFPRLFTPAGVELVQVAEQAGNIEKTLTALARGMRQGLFVRADDE